MEKVRLVGEGAESTDHLADLVTAESILDPKLLRFGNQHTLREAVWLMSEMLKRTEAKTATPLFLQNKEGKLDGGLSIWTMLAVMGKNLPESGEDLSEKDLRDHFRKSFGQSISEVCRKDLPRLTLDTPLHVLVKTAVEADLAVLPVCDEEDRLTGLVSSVDLLKGIGKSIGFNPEEELPKA